MAVKKHEPMVYNTRKKGVPPGAVYVGRPSNWGNPFHVKDFGRDDALELYRLWLTDPQQAPLRAAMRRTLRGRDLVCWCAPDRCHAELILEIANGPEEET